MYYTCMYAICLAITCIYMYMYIHVHRILAYRNMTCRQDSFYLLQWHNIEKSLGTPQCIHVSVQVICIIYIVYCLYII